MSPFLDMLLFPTAKTAFSMAIPCCYEVCLHGTMHGVFLAPLNLQGDFRFAWAEKLFIHFFYYRKRGRASYIVSDVRSVRERVTEREREREREREWDGSDVTLVALKLAKKFALFLAKTLKLAIQAIEFSAEPSFFSLKKWIKLIPKTIGNRKKRLCVRFHSGDKYHLRKSSDRKAQIRNRSFRSPDWFVLFDLQIFSGGVYPPSTTSRTISFFYFQ